MTKADLLRFLEPFTDDVKIVIYGGEQPFSCMLESTQATYRIGEKDTKDFSRDGIEFGEGYILIESEPSHRMSV